ncbi:MULTISPECIES: tRNA (guanosine(37)-N1)-methyltransferase TrmD [unclassified Salipiger]|uniref:tRNA (guanosine(37)-N1)-methyltransferase TrmD n=1 Tax=unclassified Salipiger TaxID=2640570 RepID=UPI0013BCFD68|nr:MULTISPECIES: tRNA (guanosine(37)-N1)-methyltransferase TrmD [unclassified Salipiger]NDV53147.1 tRNA (guanosine(37)-N1)-methyltransferase TrmD [Salipiger sp. PrR003]NDW34745.1 tRNA (guanosine(37)-N1)-methyltransferase TrmD [Salipiger sp. PrR007]
MTDTPQRASGRKTIRPSLTPRELMTEAPELARAFQAQVITLLPDAFPGVLGHSLTGRALQDGLWQLSTVALREFGEGRHRNVDDTPAGGGAGMVLRPDVMGRAIEHARARMPARAPLIYLSPRGRRFDQQMAQRLAQEPGVTLICGRFEGLDQRVIDHYQIIEVSLGDFVLTGGEIAAQMLLDATIRLIPGVLGNASSTEEESFSNGLLEHPQYTRPADWQGHRIPDVLLSGNHAAIEAWRRAQSEDITRARRPDLWQAHEARAAQDKS